MESFLKSLNTTIDKSKKIEFKYTDEELIKRYSENIGEIFILKKKDGQYGGTKFTYESNYSKTTEKLLYEINYMHRKIYYKNMTYILHIIHKYIIKKFCLTDFVTYMLTTDNHYPAFFKNANVNVVPSAKLNNVYANSFNILYDTSVSNIDNIFNFVNKIIDTLEPGKTLIFDTRFIFNDKFSKKIEEILQKFDECSVFVPNIYTISSGYISFVLKGKKKDQDYYNITDTYQKIIDNLTNWINEELYIYNHIMSLKISDQSKYEVLNNKLITASIANLL